MKKGELIYEGKAKRVYEALDADNKIANRYCILEFKDDLTAFDGEKFDQEEGKGELNAWVTAVLFKYLSNKQIPNHFVKRLSARELLVQRTKIIPVEVVVRNIIAGSLEKRLGLTRGMLLNFPVVEFYYKNDLLHDPLLNTDHIQVLGLANQAEMRKMTIKAKSVNTLLWQYFNQREIILVDFKLEFGWTEDKNMLIADEITPDTCRLWDHKTTQSLDKDVFRHDIGDVMTGYREIYRRMKEEGLDYV